MFRYNRFNITAIALGGVLFTCLWIAALFLGSWSPSAVYDPEKATAEQLELRDRLLAPRLEQHAKIEPVTREDGSTAFLRSDYTWSGIHPAPPELTPYEMHQLATARLFSHPLWGEGKRLTFGQLQEIIASSITALLFGTLLGWLSVAIPVPPSEKKFEQYFPYLFCGGGLVFAGVMMYKLNSIRDVLPGLVLILSAVLTLIAAKIIHTMWQKGGTNKVGKEEIVAKT